MAVTTWRNVSSEMLPVTLSGRTTIIPPASSISLVTGPMFDPYPDVEAYVAAGKFEVTDVGEGEHEIDPLYVPICGTCHGAVYLDEHDQWRHE